MCWGIRGWVPQKQLALSSRFWVTEVAVRHMKDPVFSLSSKAEGPKVIIGGTINQHHLVYSEHRSYLTRPLAVAVVDWVCVVQSIKMTPGERMLLWTSTVKALLLSNEKVLSWSTNLQDFGECYNCPLMAMLNLTPQRGEFSAV